MSRRTEEIEITQGSDNIFADLGFENPELELAKADLVINISRLMSAENLTQASVAKLIGIDQPQVSKLLRGQTTGYTLDRLTKILNQLGQDVDIVVRPKPAIESRRAGVKVIHKHGKIKSQLMKRTYRKNSDSSVEQVHENPPTVFGDEESRFAKPKNRSRAKK